MKFLIAVCLFMALMNPARSQTGNPRPNIILVVGDDMRYDSFSPNGGPEWFETPSIDRIAEEGVNFTHCFSTYALCIPARSTIMRGLYPHSNGAYGNWDNYFLSLPTMATILHNENYHTAMIGKYHVYVPQLPEFDHWISKADDVDYITPLFNINGSYFIFEENPTRIINDSVHAYLSVVDTPFFLFIGHQVPHKPVVPLPEHKGMYDGLTVAPENFAHYDLPYPSYIYDREYFTTEDRLLNDLEKYYEGLQGIEQNVADIFEVLAARNLLDNNMILFTSDHGHMYGEHLLAGKSLAYEPSIRIPMFIRYPAWFPPGSVVSGQMASNVDIAPTVVEAAGYNPFGFSFQGISMRSLFTGDSSRNLFLYENIKVDHTGSADTGDVPAIRALRTPEYKYIRSSCESPTEELFHLLTDPNENVHLINASSWAGILQQLRFTLDSLRIVLYDTLGSDTTLKTGCYLVVSELVEEAPSKGDNISSFQIDSLPAGLHVLSLYQPWRLDGSATATVEVSIFNLLGQPIRTGIFSGGTPSSEMGQNLPPGYYLIHLRQGSVAGTRFLLVPE